MPAQIWRGKVTRVGAVGTFVEIPARGMGLEFGPCQKLSDQPLVPGDRVCLASANEPDDLIVLGLLDAPNGAQWRHTSTGLIADAPNPATSKLELYYATDVSGGAWFYNGGGTWVQAGAGAGTEEVLADVEEALLVETQARITGTNPNYVVAVRTTSFPHNSSGNWVDVSWDNVTETSHDGVIYDDPWFVCPVTGFYLFSATMTSVSAAGTWAIDWQSEGGTCHARTMGDLNVVSTVTGGWRFPQGYKIKVRIYQTTGGNQTLTAHIGTRPFFASYGLVARA